MVYSRAKGCSRERRRGRLLLRRRGSFLTPDKKRRINFNETFFRVFRTTHQQSRLYTSSLSLSSLVNGMRSKKGALCLAFVATGACIGDQHRVMFMMNGSPPIEPPCSSCNLPFRREYTRAESREGEREREDTAVATPRQHTRERERERIDGRESLSWETNSLARTEYRLCTHNSSCYCCA